MLLAGALLAGYGSFGSGTPSNTIPIGTVFSLTGPGGVYGPQHKNGIQLAVDQLNAGGGIAAKKLAVTTLDDGSDKQ
ncbi:MAG: ABC transporter substrate-binding protein [Actinomycetota bacterium]|nr:ABC transporter substrate-binding protein [Actinomycetota bacterium]